MKNKRLLVVFIALVMVLSVVMSAYLPAADSASANTSNVTSTPTSSLSDVTGQYTRAFDESLFAEGVLTTAAEMNDEADVARFDADQELWVVIELEGESLISQYGNGKSAGFDSVTDYVLSDGALQDSATMLVQQNTLIRALARESIEIEYKYSYTSVLNGFAAKVRYGDISKIKAYSAVKNVIVSEVYDMPTEAVVNEVSVYDTGIFDSSECGYDGEGMVVAVLDTGIEYAHEAFDIDMTGKTLGMTRDDVIAYINEGKLNASDIYAGLDVDDVYYSAKLPFSFDYADRDTNATPSNNAHGVHVSGIIGGKSDTIVGVAPYCQILGMKIFSDKHTGAYTIDILAALEDCILLNVDVINMSLGSDGGFQTTTEGNRISELYDQLREVGITMMVAAGNSYSGAMNSAFGNTALAENPDYGIMSSPASYSTTTAVASINGQKDEYISANNGETIAFFDNASNEASRQYDFYDMLEEKLAANPSLPQFVNGQVTLEYVTVPGLGYLYNYDGIDVTNKVVLVARGVCTFQDKALAANTVGALAIIIYNNTTGVIRMSIGNGLKIPACSINKESGDAMARHATGTITLDRNSLAGPFMSDFSSWGCLPDLTLDPDITGHGGNILSSVTGNQYAVYSGTSMATPNLAGVAALLRQHLEQKLTDEDIPEGESKKQYITGLCNQILMSTSTIANDEKGKPVSPRKQGSGLANLDAALNTEAYLTVDGSEFSKLSLYDDPDKTGVYELNFNLVNWGTRSLSYNVSVDVFSECVSWVKDYEKWAVEEEAYIFDDSKISVSVENGTYSNGKITVSANTIAKISITITLSAEAKAYLNQTDSEGNLIFANGTYVEGFARLDAVESNSYNLSIPYLAFFGDWLDAPMFDYDFYAVKESENDPSLTEDEWLKATTYNTTPMAAYYLDTRTYSESYGENTYLLPLGLYVYGLPADETAITPSLEHAAISRYTYKTYGIYNVYLGLLRGAKSMEMTITDYYTGKVVKHEMFYNMRKSIGKTPSFVYDATDWTSSGETKILDNLLFYPEGEGAYNNSRYLVTLSGAIDYKNGDQVTNSSYSFEFTCDYETPIVTDIGYRIKENRDNPEEPTYYADVTVYDNHYAQCVMVGYIPEGKNQIYTIGSPTPVRAEYRGASTTVEVDITEYIDKVDEYDSFFIMVTDYAMNEGYYRVTLPRNITNISVKDEDANIALNKYQTYKVVPVVEPADQWTDGLVWTSSDETVAKVNEKGVIYAVGVGECDITVTDKEFERIAAWNTYESYEYYDGHGVPEYFRLFGEEGTPLFSNSTYWDGKVTIHVTVTDPEGNRYVESTPDKVIIEGYTYVKAFERDLFGVNFKLDTVRDINSTDVYPDEVINIQVSAEPWNIDFDKYYFKWSTNKADIATIDQEGNLTAHSDGRVTISISVCRISDDRVMASTSTRLDISEPYVISNYVLTKYYGYGDENGVVELPNDQYYNAIDDFAFCYVLKEREDSEYNEDEYYKYFKGNDKITKVIIPDGIESIGNYAFYNCTSLTTVEMPYVISEGTTKYLTVIGTGAFRGCTSLTTLNIGNPEDKCAPIAYIGAYAFMDCTSLKSINLRTVTWMETMAFYGCTSLVSVDLPLLSRCGTGAFYGCTSLVDVKLYEDTVIGNYMFTGCSKLASVTIPGEAIGAYAFADCSRLATVKFTGAIDTIGAFAFYGDTALANVSFESEATLGSIGQLAFYNCTSLKKFTLNNNSVLTSGANGAIIYGNGGKEFVLIAPAYNMGAFDWANSNIEIIGKNAFSGRTDFVSVLDMSKSTTLKVIDDYAFYGNLSLKSVVFPACLETIGIGAFRMCYSLTNVTIPDDVNVGDYAFAECVRTSNSSIVSGLQTVTLGKNVTLGEGAFYASQYLQKVNLPDEVDSVKLGYGAFNKCMYLSDIDLTKFTVIPDACFGYCLSLSSVDLSQVKSIGDYAFAQYGYNGSLTNVDLSSVESLGSRAFYGCVALEKVVLGNALKVINDYTFQMCINLSEINLNYVEEIGEGAFFYNLGNTELSSNVIYVKDTYTTGIKTLELDNCKKIGLGAFSFCPWIETIYAPVVEEICDAAFNPTQSVDDPVSPKEYVFVSNIKSVDFGTADRDIVIGSLVFYRAKNMTTVNGLDNVVSVGENAFAYCEGLTELVMNNLTNEGVTATNAFAFCKSLEKVEMKSLKVVADNMFEGCEKLADVEFAPEMTSIGKFAFAQTAIETFDLVATLESIGEGAFYQTENLKAFTDGKVSDKVFVENGMLYTVLETGYYELISVPAKLNVVDMTVVEGTVRVAFGAFNGNGFAKTITLPMTLKVIAPNAFGLMPSLRTIVFRSYNMPVLETEIQKYIFTSVHSSADFVQINDNIVNYYGSLGMQYFYPYYQVDWLVFNEETFDCTVNATVMAVYPSNGKGYDGWIFNKMFAFTTAGAATLDDNGLAAQAAMMKLPDRATLNDEAVIVAAREAYSKVYDPYQINILSDLYANLGACEKRLAQLKAAQEGVDTPEQPKNYEKLYNELLNKYNELEQELNELRGDGSTSGLREANEQLTKSNASLKVSVIVVSIVAGLIAAGFVLYIFVFSKKNF